MLYFLYRNPVNIKWASINRYWSIMDYGAWHASIGMRHVNYSGRRRRFPADSMHANSIKRSDVREDK